MPVVTVNRDELYRRLEQEYVSDEEFDHLCFEFGIELDDVTSEKEQIRKQKGDKVAEESGASEDVVYKIDVPANRYDLLCLEGIVRALRIFQGKEKCPAYKVLKPPNRIQVHVKAATQQVRKYFVGAVLRNVVFDKVNYGSFLDIQEKLHFNICRRRKYVAIGTHDLDTIKPPFIYDARTRDEIKFVALKEEKEMTATELFHEYRTRDVSSLRQYLPIIDDSPVVPVIYDQNDEVLSLPPIINGRLTQLTLDTKNIFIDCTATDITKARIVINTLCSMFSQYCSEPFSIEAIDVVYEEVPKNVQPVEISPNMDALPFKTTVDYINKGAGINITPQSIVDLLYRMQLPAKYSPDTNEVNVWAPPTRSDILHACDIQEDVAIAYGYNNIKRTLPKSYTISRQQPLNKLSDLLRQNVAMAGFTEVLTWILVSKQENFDNMNRPNNGTAVELSNPKSKEFELCRTSLLPGILKTTAHNLGRNPLPITLFELGDIVTLSKERKVGAKNQRKLAAIYCGQSEDCMNILHGLLDRVMTLNSCKYRRNSEIREMKHDYSNDEFNTYSIQHREQDDETFIPARQLEVKFKYAADSEYRVIGEFGIVNPDVCSKFGIDNMLVAALELDVEVFLPY